MFCLFHNQIEVKSANDGNDNYYCSLVTEKPSVSLVATHCPLCNNSLRDFRTTMMEEEAQEQMYLLCITK